MAINAIPPITDRYSIRRMNAPGDPAAPRPNAQLLQAEQAGRQTSALLSTLPGPNMSFFQAPAPPVGMGGAGQQGFAAAGAGAGPGQRLNVPLLETMQQGREASTLFSGLEGPNPRAFPAPVPPAFAQGGAAGTAPGAAPPAGPTVPRAGAQLLETEQAGRTTSTLLSSLAGPGPAPGFAGAASPFARPTVGAVSGNAMAAMRTAEQVIQDVGTAAPSAQNMRIANEAYQMEAQAQRDFETQGAVGRMGTWEWFA